MLGEGTPILIRQAGELAADGYIDGLLTSRINIEVVWPNPNIVKIPGQQRVANRVNHGRLPAVVFPYQSRDTRLKSEHKGPLSSSKLPEVTD
jgi:hypothetical protein